MKLPKELIEAARNNNLVTWIGAGLSYNFKNKAGRQLKDWKNLVVQIKNSFPEEKYLTAVLMKSALNRGDESIQVLDVFEILSKLPKSEIVNYVKYFYSSFDYDREWLLENSSKQIITKNEAKQIAKHFYTLSEKQDDWSLHENLCELSNIIITTNYDDAFELTCKRINRPIKTILLSETIELQGLNDLQKITLIKLHGSISDEDTMVIFPYDYAHLYEHRAHSLILELRKLILTKSMLFVGCGMGDWQINNIFKFARKTLADLNQKHFIITTEQKYNEIKKDIGDFLELIPIKDYKPDIDDIIKYLLNEKSSITAKVEFDFCSKADEIFNKALLLKDENLLIQCCELYEKAATSLNSRDEKVFYKWGITLLELAKLKKSELLYKKSKEIFDIITVGLNPYNEKVSLYKRIIADELKNIDIEYITNRNKFQKNMIPVKTCLCGCINPCESSTCKRCGKPLGEKWLDDGHISAGVCKKCRIVTIDNACPTCGDKIPEFYGYI
jgi:hypothetical protein